MPPKTKAENQKEEDVFIVPDLNIRISMAWVNLIRFCQVQFPHGDIKIRIVNAQPTDLLEKNAKVRFDKEMTIPNVDF